ncbi:DinB family protein [Mucilaginibacter ginsenosidivorax]|uniref:DinB family protein n=1 Tax=Mucilaginibacter ginsenosidivorax TaxID=862126 RepID=A0A5B8WB28_9SPHI|nr:DinB family protein [Mucilaginibacter ginsenosidivorax]QEC80075.1 DinB family protein [Mucilaginibacter ginsenosidivorax]
MTTTSAILNTAITDFLQTRSSDDNWDLRPAPGKWSKKEVIGHLIDSAQINLQRFVRCTYEENFKLVYQQDAYVAVQHYHDVDIKELLDLWILLNRQIIRVWENYPADRLTARCDNSKSEPNLQTVEWLANDYVEHLMHHLKTI